jgi:hypothetical protein
MNDRERQAGKPWPRTHVEDALTLKQGACDETVQKVRRDHIVSISNRSEVDLAIPALELVDQCAQLFRATFREGLSKALKSGLYFCCQ